MKNPKFLVLKRVDDGSRTRRNYQCPDYEECLDQAAYTDCDLDCSGCLLKEEKASGCRRRHGAEAQGYCPGC